MATPICAHVRKPFEPMRYPMIQLLFFGICLCVRLADTLGDDTFVTLLVASVLAILTLHACRILEEVSTQSAPHDVIELLLYEFVAVHLVDFFFTLPDSTLTVQTNIERSSILHLLGCSIVSQVK